MGREVVNLLVIILVGVIIANMISQTGATGTQKLFCNIGNFWQISVGGMLGQPTTNLPQC